MLFLFCVGLCVSLRPRRAPQPFGRGVDMGHATIATDDHDRIFRVLEGGEQEIGAFERSGIGWAHRLAFGLDGRGNRRRSRPA